MNWKPLCRITFFLLGIFVLTNCENVSDISVQYDPGMLQFSGDSARAFAEEFVERFPNRDSGQPNNEKAADWLRDKFESYGLTTRMDHWEIVNYSRPVSMQNVIGVLPGQSSREILIVAHLDQSPDTEQGADNDGSGIAVLMQLAQIFADQPGLPYTLVFLASDGEEYGMLGTRRYVQTHPQPDSIIAGLSLDNVGKKFYRGLRMDARGQFRGFGALWFQRTAQEVARAAGDLWVPRMNAPVFQILDQAVPISFMDEGPMVAAGIPSFGLAGWVPPENREKHWETYHTPEDRIELQSATSLYHTGRVSEALIRHCLSMNDFPQETGPYIYFQKSGQVLRGLFLWLIFIFIVVLFFAFKYRFFRRLPSDKYDRPAWKDPVLHFLSLWLPLVLGLLLLYLFVAVGLMDTYHLYPATAKDDPLFYPRWPAVILWIIGLIVFFWGARKVTGRWITQDSISGYYRKVLTSGVVGFGAVYLLFINPFSLIFILPLLLWSGISGQPGQTPVRDWVLLILGGTVIYVLIYFFGFVILRNDFAILWYLMMMFSIHMISFPTALMITATLAAGLSLVVPVAVKA